MKWMLKFPVFFRRCFILAGMILSAFFLAAASEEKLALTPALSPRERETVLALIWQPRTSDSFERSQMMLALHEPCLGKPTSDNSPSPGGEGRGEGELVFLPPYSSQFRVAIRDKESASSLHEPRLR